MCWQAKARDPMFSSFLPLLFLFFKKKRKETEERKKINYPSPVKLNFRDHALSAKKRELFPSGRSPSRGSELTLPFS